MKGNRKPHSVASEKIDIATPEQVRYWCKQFACTQSNLRAAVKIVGPVVADVKKCLKRRSANS
jgi:hypothetical protein